MGKLRIQLHFGGLLLAAGFRVARRRLTRGKLRPAWSFVQEVTVEALRANGRLLMRLPPAANRARSDALGLPAKRGVRVEQREHQGRPVTAFVPEGAVDASPLLYVHGGAFVFGSIASYAEVLSRLALALRRTVLGFEYRLAPEAPFPAGLDDVVATYQAVRTAHPRVVLAGDSAGGGLVASALVRMRDAGQPLPPAAILISPWVDLTAEAPSVEQNAPFDWGDRAYLLHWINLYAPEAERRSPLASPRFARLQGLPPLAVHVGQAELLRDEALALASSAQAAGTPVELTVWPDMVHGWIFLPGAFPQAEETLTALAGFLERHGL